MPFIICLLLLAVIDPARLVCPTEIDRTVVILDLGLAACPAIGLDVITLCDLICIHNYIGL